MHIATAYSTEPDTLTAVQCCYAGLDIASHEPSWLLFFHSEGYDSQLAVDELSNLSGTARIHGGTSCLGVMTRGGFHSDAGVGMGVLAIIDPAGNYGIGVAQLDNDPRRAAADAINSALLAAERSGEVPALVWINSAPGKEEELLGGIEEVLGSKVPIAGGSTGDNSVASNWRQIAGTGVYQDAIVVSVFFPSVEISNAFHSGYNPTNCAGRVTATQGRFLHSIDGRPAAEVYNQWTDGLIEAQVAGGGSTLLNTTFAPLGREVGRVGGIPYYKLSHPERVTKSGALTSFTDFARDDEVVLMTGSRDSLISRAGRVTKSAITAGEFAPEEISGALVIYCAGCMLTVRDEMDKVVDEITRALNGAPFLGMFTFGEQGCFVGQENSHGNLMVSVVVFSNRERY